MTGQIDVNAIADVLNNKVDLAEGANQASVDYVVESQLPTAQNNYTWYRLYKSGWVEQGGSVGTGETTLVFLKQMQDTTYFICLTAGRESNWAGDYAPQFYSKTNTGVKIKFDSESTHNVWEVKGMSAQGGS